VHKHAGDGRIHAAGERADDAFVADLRTDGCNQFILEVCGAVVALELANALEEVLKKLLPVLRVCDFRVKLNAVYSTILIGKRSDRASVG